MRTFKLKIFFHPLAVLLIIAAAVITYANSFNGPFLFDDYHNIVGNKNVQLTNLSYSSLKRAAVEEPSRYRWIPKITFALNYYFAKKEPVDFHAATTPAGHGFAEPSVWGYHLVNLLIHMSAGICLYFLFFLTLKAPVFKSLKYVKEIALLGALLWIAHPVQTNAVTYIVQRMTGMGALFSIMSMLFYVLGRRQGLKGILRYVLFAISLFAWFLALFSKENAAILPAILVGYELYFLSGILVSLKSRKTLIWLAAAVILVIAMGWLYLGRNPFSVVLSGYGSRDFTLTQRLLTQPRVVLHYLSLLLVPLPSRLTLAYDWPTSTGLLAPPATVLAILGLAVMVILIFFLFKRDRLLSFAIFWFLVNLLIESSVIPLEMVFEHRLYLPSAFLALALVYKSYEWGRQRIWLVRSLFTVLVLVFVIFTWQRNNTWASRENVWADVALKAPGLTRGHMGLYVAYKAQGRDNEALQVLKKAIEVGPDEFRPSFNLANYYKEKKQYKQALQVLNTMMTRENLRTAPAYHLRASIYFDLNNYQAAVADALMGIEVDPQHLNSLLVLGSSYFRLNNFPQAANYFEKARNIESGTYGIYYNLGTTYYNMGKYDKAILNYTRALDFMPNNADIHYNLGMVYGAKGMVKEMQEELAISRRLKGQIK